MAKHHPVLVFRQKQPDIVIGRLCKKHVKNRDGCPKIVNLGSAKIDRFYEREKYGFKKR
uniref:Uncharacterized protein n=1 Tax=Octopus bimaculoides TaxID=37653 RepID=A0A0L8GQI0_OCTBM